MPDKRRTATLFLAEIVDYATLLRRDEEEARQLADAFRRTLADLLDRYDGELLRARRDGSLCVFDDPVAAASCALELQRVVHGDPGMPLRITLHQGELIALGDDLLGDGVVTARELGSLPPAGAVLLSDSIYEYICGLPRFDIVALGRLAGINIDRPVDVFALANEGLTVPPSSILKQPGARQPMGAGAIVAIVVMVILMIVIGVYIARIFLTAEAPQ